MSSLTFGEGSVSFRMDGDFTELVRRAVDQAMPGVLDRVEAAVARVGDAAVAGAPVDTGTFRASIRREVQMAPDLSSVRGRVYSDLDYAKYIKSARLPGTGSAFVELFRKPMEAEGDRVVADLRDVLERELGG